MISVIFIKAWIVIQWCGLNSSRVKPPQRFMGRWRMSLEYMYFGKTNCYTSSFMRVGDLEHVTSCVVFAIC